MFKIKNVLIFIFLILLVATNFGCSTDDKPQENVEVNAVQRIKASVAIRKAINIINNPKWRIAYISNTGVTGSVTSNKINKLQDGLMLQDGSAGQWVIEFFEDAPIKIVDGNREGKSYPFRKFIITANDITELPESKLNVSNKLPELNKGYLDAMELALKLAIEKNKEKFDVISVASDVISNGDCYWFFRFYDISGDNISNKIIVSGDGKTQIK